MLGNNRKAFKNTMRNLSLSVAAFALVVACVDNEKIQPGPRYSLDGQRVGLGDVSSAGEALRLGPVSSGDWSQHLGNAQHVAPNARLSANPQLAARVPLGIQSRRPVYGAAVPIIVGGVIYHYDADGILHAFNSQGGQIWSTSLVPADEFRGDGFGGGLAYQNGKLYAATGYGEVLSIDARNGNVLWRYKQASPLRKAPLVGADRVVFTVEGKQAVALNLSTGAQLWRQYTAQSLQPARITAGVPASSGSQVIVGYSSGEIQNLNSSNGSVNWNIDNISDYYGGSKSLIGDISGDPVIAGGSIYSATNSGVSAVSLGSGQVLWANNIGSKGPISVSGNSVFGISENEQVYRLSADSGKTIWARNLPRSANAKNYFAKKYQYFDARLVNNEIWVFEKSGILHRYNSATGALNAKLEIPALAATPVFGDGMMVGISQNGELLIFR